MPSPRQLFRVFPWLETAGEDAPGHPLYVAPPQGHGRIDNPHEYLTLYACDHAAGAIGEAFGNHSTWTYELLEGPPGLPDSERALASIDASNARIVDLDDARALLDRGIRPSRVVTRERRVTQNWALAIFTEDRWDGVRWWSYHNPDWGSVGIWNIDALRVVEVTPLSEITETVREVALDMNREWVPR